jgi:hypothetical protein
MTVTTLTSLAMACSSGGEDKAPVASVTSSSSTVATTVIDYSGVLLPGVRGSTTSTIATRGDASLVGVVTGPDGPVPSAVVRIDRLVADQVRRTDVVAGADGRFQLRGIPGGRYRVRAYLSPTFAQTEPDIFFLPGRDERRLDLRVDRFDGTIATTAVAPDPPILDQAVNVAVRIVNRAVNADGVAVAVPRAGAEVELVEVGRWSLTGDAIQTTDGSGRVVFAMRCDAAGAPGLVVRLRGAIDLTTLRPMAPISLAVPGCIDPASTTTVAPATTTTTG